MVAPSTTEILARHNLLAAQVARKLEINKSTVHRWKRIPAERVLQLEEVFGIPRAEMRPDLYPAEAAAQ